MRKITLLIPAVLTLLLFAACNSGEKCDMKKAEKISEIKAIDLANLDKSVCPTVDFYEYATGGWQANNPLPDDESIFGTFNLLAKETSKKVNGIIRDLAKKDVKENSVEWKVQTLYNLGMDTVKIEEDGIKPIEKYLSKIEGIDNKDDVIEYIAKFHSYGIPTTFALYGTADREDSDMQIAYLYQGGLGLPNRDYYTSDEPRSIEIRERYLEYLKTMHTLLGEDEESAEKIANQIMAFETKLAENSMTNIELRDVHATTNRMNINEVDELMPNVNIKNYFNYVGLPAPGTINVSQPDFFSGLSEIFENTDIDTWQKYFRWNLVNYASPYLSSDFDKTRFDFYGTFLSGTQQQRQRWRRVVDQTNSSLGEAVGIIFVDKYFPPEAKERMEELVDNLKYAFERRINNLDWMTDETKENAVEKLHTMNVKIGYPDKWRDYSYLNIKDDYYFSNVLRANTFDFEYMISKIGKPVDKDEWFMNPQTVNAYYAPSLNEICFPAGILQPPFFFMDADDAVNYGAIGMVIGHEMTHGFDDRGRNFDANGNLKNWWTEQDAELFDNEAQILVERYNNIVVLEEEELFADGELTLGENIADFGGLKIAYDGLMLALNGEEPEPIDGFTAQQRFFLAYANVWAQNVRNEEIMRRTKEGVHSIGKWRVNGQLVGLPEFHKAFNVSEGDPMYLPKEKMTNIW